MINTRFSVLFNQFGGNHGETQKSRRVGKRKGENTRQSSGRKKEGRKEGKNKSVRRRQEARIRSIHFRMAAACEQNTPRSAARKTFPERLRGPTAVGGREGGKAPTAPAGFSAPQRRAKIGFSRHHEPPLFCAVAFFILLYQAGNGIYN